MISVAIFFIAGAVAFLLVAMLSRSERILTPLSLFLALELAATWPALIKEAGGRVTDDGIALASLAAASLTAVVLAYAICGGFRRDGLRWRGTGSSPPETDRLRALGQGLWLLIAVLVGISLWRFQGLPPMLTGGFSSLIDPVGHSDQVAQIRESRRVLTKGYLVGESYRGQGALNAFTEAGWQVVVIAAVLRNAWCRTSASAWQLAGIAVLGFIFLGSSGQRGPLIMAAVAAAGAAALLWRVSTKKLMLAALTGSVFALFISPLSKGATGGTGIGERLVALFQRVTEGNGQNTIAIINLIDNGTLQVAYGQVFLHRLLVMVPGAPVGDPFALTITRLAYGSGSNTTGFSTPTNFGLLYADGAYVAVIVGYFALGVVMALVWGLLTTIRSELGAVLQVQGAIVLGHMSITGIHGLLANAMVSALAVGVLFSPLVLHNGLRPGPSVLQGAN